MKKIVKRDKSTSSRSKNLGDIGETLTEFLLMKSDFNNIQNLNLIKNNFPFADYFAEKDNICYVISVKMRNKYQFTTNGAKKLNSRYNLGSKCYEHANNAEKQYNAKAAFLSISLDFNTYCAYFGLLSDLNGSLGINMSEKAVIKYTCLAKDALHDFNYADIKNEYEILK